MTDVRTVLAAVLGVGVGLVLVAYPDAVVRMYLAGRVPGDRSGEYGDDGRAPKRWRQIVRVLGVGTVVTGGYFGLVAAGLV